MPQGLQAPWSAWQELEEDRLRAPQGGTCVAAGPEGCRSGWPPVLDSTPRAERQRPPTSGQSCAVGAGVGGPPCSPVSFQDPALKLCLIQSVCMASQAICSSAQAGSFHFSRKAELVAQMMVSSGRGPAGARVAPRARPQTGELGLETTGGGGCVQRGARHPPGLGDRVGQKPAPGRWLTRRKAGAWAKG